MFLEYFLFIAILIVTGAVLFSGILKRGGYVMFPTLFAAVYAGWIIPQLWNLVSGQLAPDESLIALLLMSLLCLGAAIVGWRVANSNSTDPLESYLPRVHEREIGKAATILTGVALIGFFGIGFDPMGSENGSMWTGRVTIFSLLFGSKSASIALSLMYYLRRRNLFGLFICAINIIMFAPYVIIYFRRQVILEFLIIIPYVFLVFRNYAFPRMAALTILVAASLGIFAAGEIRNISLNGEALSLAKIAEIDFLALNPINNPQSAPELENALNLIKAVEVSGNYTLGGQLWNQFVFQYVPAQFVGVDVKWDLMVAPWPAEITYKVLGYIPASGSTQTGIATAFMEFWFFGCILFFFNAYIMGRLWRRALLGNNWDKVWYAAGIVPSLHMVTHQSAIFYVSFSFFVILLAVVAFLLRLNSNASTLQATSRDSGPRPAWHGK